MIEKILSNLQAEADFFGGEPMGSLQKMYYCEGVKRAIEVVQEVAKEYGKDTNVLGNGWISVEERLPKDFRGVLITAIALNGTSYTEIGKWNGEQWFHGASNTRIDIAEVIAWMELPAPYQKGE